MPSGFLLKWNKPRRPAPPRPAPAFSCTMCCTPTCTICAFLPPSTGLGSYHVHAPAWPAVPPRCLRLKSRLGDALQAPDATINRQLFNRPPRSPQRRAYPLGRCRVPRWAESALSTMGTPAHLSGRGQNSLYSRVDSKRIPPLADGGARWRHCRGQYGSSARSGSRCRRHDQMVGADDEVG